MMKIGDRTVNLAEGDGSFAGGLVIEGGRRLEGEIKVQGAKNSSLPVLAAAYLCGGESVIHNCPALSDCYAACRILSSLGCRCKREGSTVIVDSGGTEGFSVSESLMSKMRSSIVFLGDTGQDGQVQALLSGRLRARSTADRPPSRRS